MRTMRALSVALASLTVVAAAQKPPSAEELRERAVAYIAKYTEAVSGVSLDEMFLLVETTGGRMSVPYRLASDLVFVAQDDYPIGLRDLYAIDTRAVRDHSPRVMTALTQPGGGNIELIRRYVRENANLFLHNVVVWYNDPMLALRFGAANVANRLNFKLEGNKKMNGTAVLGLGFKEKPNTDPILDKVPGNARSSGRLWIDPVTGAIHQTELWVESQTDSVRLRVDFAPEAKLGLLLPRQASHNFDWREFGANSADSMASRMKLSFEANVEYSKATHTPIK